MRRAAQTRGKVTPGLVVSLGVLAVGIVMVGCAAANISAASLATADASRTALSIPATSAVSRVSAATETAPAALYSSYPSKGDVIGTLSIPALSQKIPIIEGTDDADLKRGVGHFVSSVLPGEPDNCVLSGHRDTVFSKLGKLKVGDVFVTKTSAGSFTYEISRIRIVDKDDKTIIVPASHAVLTVSTCYPFRYVGSAPNRYVLIADLVTR